jgi:hypothetical protein
MRYRNKRAQNLFKPEPKNGYGMEFNCPVEDEWVFRLIAAIIVRAREDYVLGDDTVRSFVYSDWFATITEIDPEWFMKQLIKARRDKSRKYNCRDWRDKFDR